MTHGHTIKHLRKNGGSLTYVSWQAMLQRCANENVSNWRLYGGRGIRVHQQWIDNFETFLEYMGPRPSAAHSIDRFPDQNGNYEPGNVRWATAKQQGRNTRSCKLTEIDAAFIRHWCAIGFSNQVVADAFDVSKSNVSAIKRGLIWA